MTCSLCGSTLNEMYNGGFVMSSGEWCTGCEGQRLALGKAFLDETGSTWLYDKGEFVLRTVRGLLKNDETC
jgi:hypothetical protein